MLDMYINKIIEHALTSLSLILNVGVIKSCPETFWSVFNTDMNTTKLIRISNAWFLVQSSLFLKL